MESKQASNVVTHPQEEGSSSLIRSSGQGNIPGGGPGGVPETGESGNMLGRGEAHRTGSEQSLE